VPAVILNEVAVAPLTAGVAAVASPVLVTAIPFIVVPQSSGLLIYVFNPRVDRSILVDNETKVLLYLFGFILLITAKWELFFKESPLLKKFQHSV
jgi:hypothetical protein